MVVRGDGRIFGYDSGLFESSSIFKQNYIVSSIINCRQYRQGAKKNPSFWGLAASWTNRKVVRSNKISSEAQARDIVALGENTPFPPAPPFIG